MPGGRITSIMGGSQRLIVTVYNGSYDKYHQADIEPIPDLAVGDWFWWSAECGFHHPEGKPIQLANVLDERSVVEP